MNITKEQAQKVRLCTLLKTDYTQNLPLLQQQLFTKEAVVLPKATNPPSKKTLQGVIQRLRQQQNNSEYLGEETEEVVGDKQETPFLKQLVELWPGAFKWGIQDGENDAAAANEKIGFQDQYSNQNNNSSNNINQNVEKLQKQQVKGSDLNISKSNSTSLTGSRRVRNEGQEEDANSPLLIFSPPAKKKKRVSDTNTPVFSPMAQPSVDHLHVGVMDYLQVDSVDKNIQLSSLRKLKDVLHRGWYHGQLGKMDIQIIMTLLNAIKPFITKSQNLKNISEEQKQKNIRIHHENQLTYLLSLESTAILLYVFSTENMDTQVLSDDLLEDSLRCVLLGLEHVIFAFCCPRLSEFTPGSQFFVLSALNKQNQKKGQSDSKIRKQVEDFVETVIGKQENILLLIQKMLAVLPVESRCFLPLINTLIKILTITDKKIQGICLLSVNIVSLFFSKHLDLYSKITEMIFQNLIPHLAEEKTWEGLNQFIVSDSIKVSFVSLLLCQLIQSVCILPDENPQQANIMELLSVPQKMVFSIWARLLDMIKQNKVAKVENIKELKLVIQGILGDFLNMMSFPEFACASLILRAFVRKVIQQLQEKQLDSHFKQHCIEFVGMILIRITHLQVSFPNDFDPVLDQIETSYNPFLEEFIENIQQEDMEVDRKLAGSTIALVSYLKNTHDIPQIFANNGVQFLFFSYFFQESRIQKSGTGSSANLLMLINQMRQSLKNTNHFEESVGGRDEACAICRWMLVFSQGGSAGLRRELLSFLAEAGNRCKQEINQKMVRTKVLKVVGQVAQLDSKVLETVQMRAVLQAAFNDESDAVREAAIDLLGKQMVGHPEQCGLYIEDLVTAAQGSGVSVRTRALKTLWECCVMNETFDQRVEAGVAVLSNGMERKNAGRLRKQVTKQFMDLWLASTCKKSQDIMVHIFGSSYQEHKSGDNVLPLVPSHPIIVLLREMQELLKTSKNSADYLSALKSVPQYLLESILSANDKGQDYSNQLLCIYLILEEDLWKPDVDSRVLFVRSIAPYLKRKKGNIEKQVQARQSYTNHLLQSPQTTRSTGTHTKGHNSLYHQSQQQYLVLVVLDRLIAGLEFVDPQICSQMCVDIRALLQSSNIKSVIQAGCQCLCCLADRDKVACQKFLHIFDSTHVLLQSKKELVERTMHNTGKIPAVVETSLMLPLIRAGYLLRYGCHLLSDIGNKFEDFVTTTLDFEQKMRQTGGCPSAQATAAEALCSIFFVRPQYILDSRIQPLLRSFLEKQSPIDVKLKVIAFVLEMAVCEEVARIEQGKCSEMSSPSKRHKPNLQLQQGLQKVNGYTDDSSFLYGMVQGIWDQILALVLTLDKEGQSVKLRQRTLELIELIMRGGMVAPFTAFPTLIASSTDPVPFIAEFSLKILQSETQKRTDYLVQSLSKGLQLTYLFHSTSEDENDVQQGTMGVISFYKQIIQESSSKQIKNSFRKSILKPFEKVCCRQGNISVEDVNPNELIFISNVVCKLPIRQGIELYGILSIIQDLIQSKGEDVLGSLLQELILDDSQDAMDATNAEDVQHAPRTSDYDTNVELSLAQFSVLILVCLRRYLFDAYNVNINRLVLFVKTSERQSIEEKMVVNCDDDVKLNLKGINWQLSNGLIKLSKLQELTGELQLVLKFQSLLHAEEPSEGVAEGDNNNNNNNNDTNGSKIPKNNIKNGKSLSYQKNNKPKQQKNGIVQKNGNTRKKRVDRRKVAMMFDDGDVSSGSEYGG